MEFRRIGNPTDCEVDVEIILLHYAFEQKLKFFTSSFGNYKMYTIDAHYQLGDTRAGVIVRLDAHERCGAAAVPHLRSRVPRVK